MPTGFETHGAENGVAEGGVDFRYCKNGPEGDPGEGALLSGVELVSRLVRDCRTPADACRRRSAYRSDDTQRSSWEVSTSASRR